MLWLLWEFALILVIQFFYGIIAKKLATIIAIVIAVIIYALAIIALKVFTKEEIQMMPAGEKIWKVLEKLKIY